VGEVIREEFLGIFSQKGRDLPACSGLQVAVSFSFEGKVSYTPSEHPKLCARQTSFHSKGR
jgi:hypothetical protein